MAMDGESEARRRKEIAKIHIAKKRLGLDDDNTYRAFLMRVAGTSSAAELNQEQRSRVLDAFKACGFREGHIQIAKLEDFDDPEPQMRLVRALWADLAALNALGDASDKALRSFIKRTAKADSIRWLGPHEANKVIEALKAWKARVISKQMAAR